MLNLWVSPQYDALSLGSSSVFFMEAPVFYKFSRGLREPLAFAIKIGHQSVSCPGCLIGMLLSLQKDKQKVIHEQKRVYGHNILQSTPLPSVEVLPHPAGCAASSAFLRAPKAFSVA